MSYVASLPGPFQQYDDPAVQSPMGDISYMLKFFRDYIGMQASLLSLNIPFPSSQ